MTSNEAILKLQLLLDKTGSPYFTTDEYLSFLNMAQLEFLNRLIPDTIGGVANFETDQNTLSNIQGLISVGISNIDNNNVMSNAALNTALVAASGDPSAEYFRIIALTFLYNGTTYPVKFVKHNNIGFYNRNQFKAPSLNRIYYSLFSNGIKVYIDLSFIIAGSAFHITFIKKPKILTSVNSPDFDDYVMNQIIQVAYQMATVATRDEAGLQLGTNTTIQSK